MSVSSLIENLRANAAISQEADVASVATHYSAMFAGLLECLRQLFTEWTVYLDHHSTSYSAPVVQANQTGRPNFGKATSISSDFHGHKLQKYWEFHTQQSTEDDRNKEWKKNVLEI